ncbi:hypothetical protein SAMN05444716_104516 [Streptomyces harbinensis]|uniref:Uncharacterized protein n=1 Tax=Streptomyces harbinensis TaxID=1176198 RepID=A0A1I6TAZ8_9ACTN|nr:hypothetical protein SAMN05444716_104516 [Streptomyces harbinensis]
MPPGPGPGQGGVVVSESQSLICSGSVPRKAVMIIRSLAMVYAWVSWSGNGGVNRDSWCRRRSNPHTPAWEATAASSLYANSAARASP